MQHYYALTMRCAHGAIRLSITLKSFHRSGKAGNPTGKQYIKASIEKDIVEALWTNNAKPHRVSFSAKRLVTIIVTSHQSATFSDCNPEGCLI